jgi:hypothetical protein
MDNHEFDDLLRRTMAELTEKFTHTTEIDVTLASMLNRSMMMPLAWPMMSRLANTNLSVQPVLQLMIEVGGERPGGAGRRCRRGRYLRRRCRNSGRPRRRLRRRRRRPSAQAVPDHNASHHDHYQ